MSGELYRAKMRVAHRLGFCWPKPVQGRPPEAHDVWCHWCGMRGIKPADVTHPDVLARIEREMAPPTPAPRGEGA